MQENSTYLFATDLAVAGDDEDALPCEVGLPHLHKGAQLRPAEQRDSNSQDPY